MASNTPSGYQVILRDLQGNRSVEQFLAHLYKDVSSLLSSRTKVELKGKELLRMITGAVEAEALSIKLPEADWRRVLEQLLDDLEAWGEKNQCVVILMWDEFTWFLHDMFQSGAGKDAMTLLDRLRATRQSGRHTRLRFVFTGSIGMEEVVDRLKASGYANDPFNDVQREVVPLLDTANAVLLACALIPPEQAALAPALAKLCEGHPYFLHHIAAKLRDSGTWTEASGRTALEQLLEAEQDPLELRQYLERMKNYYPEDRNEVFQLLDLIAQQERSLDELAGLSGIQRERVFEITTRLRRDLYINRENGKFSFRMKLLKQFWCLERGLPPTGQP
jgi:hypothetical protein